MKVRMSSAIHSVRLLRNTALAILIGVFTGETALAQYEIPLQPNTPATAAQIDYSIGPPITCSTADCAGLPTSTSGLGISDILDFRLSISDAHDLREPKPKYFYTYRDKNGWWGFLCQEVEDGRVECLSEWLGNGLFPDIP